ncbi:AraC family transcriptional regulator [Halalkalibacter sp. APA_J-10(15)]|uniref:helix-turn-helix transcriptional regulator n=1 Tax=unclassified Halalkalibacter TaxID=2893063 RepID=UPI001FF5A596|nr:AraC family transcriptional regulator [Halalkalibacter sp. APA_J-10(15)]MCK0470513.1 AraC family transcriptional regulator [Halalkalibacter sp. APA_J-10(15)]
MECNWLSFGYKKNDTYGMEHFHTHRDFEIYYFHEGRSRIFIQHRIYDLHPGDIVILNGLTKHRTCPFPSHSNVRTTVEFFPEYIEPVLQSLEAIELLELFQDLNNSLIRVEDKANLTQIESSLLKIKQLLSHSRESFSINNRFVESKVKHLLVELLFEINHLSQLPIAEILTKKNTSDRQIEYMLAWIMDHYMEKISLDRLSQEFKLNKHYISHLFKQSVGMTVMEYVMSCRIDHAKFMLEMEPYKNISDISMDVGFESSAHFSRVFRQKVGLSPSLFRKQRVRKSYQQ